MNSVKKSDSSKPKTANGKVLPTTANGLEKSVNSLPPSLVISSDKTDRNTPSSLSTEETRSLENGKLVSEKIETEFFKLKQQSRPSSAVSRNWKIVQNVVIANNAFQKGPAENKQNKKVIRQMQGSKAYIPVLPFPLAVILLICNCIIPGLGTILSGFTFFCVATTYDQSDRELLKDKIPGMVMSNVCVGIAQLFTVTFLLVGWFWSISWGITMLYLALENEDGSNKT